MKNRVQGNLIIAAVWANSAGWISHKSLAVTGPARFSKIDGQEFMKLERDDSATIIAPENMTRKSRKAAQDVGWRGSALKSRGFFEKIPKDVNLLYLPQRKSVATQCCQLVYANR
jgi:hypothetical protein